MPQVEGFTVSIIDCDTKTQLEEYKVTTTANKTECYIESVAEKQFSISIQLDVNTLRMSSAYGLSLAVDGKSIVTHLLGHLGDTFYTNCNITGAEDGLSETRPFVFGNTQFTGSLFLHTNPLSQVEDGQIDKKLLSNLGSITIRIHRKRVLRRSDNEPCKIRRVRQTSETSVNEKAKKALLTHSVK